MQGEDPPSGMGSNFQWQPGMKELHGKSSGLLPTRLYSLLSASTLLLPLLGLPLWTKDQQLFRNPQDLQHQNGMLSHLSFGWAISLSGVHCWITCII